MDCAQISTCPARRSALTLRDQSDKNPFKGRTKAQPSRLSKHTKGGAKKPKV